MFYSELNVIVCWIQIRVGDVQLVVLADSEPINRRSSILSTGSYISSHAALSWIRHVRLMIVDSCCMFFCCFDIVARLEWVSKLSCSFMSDWNSDLWLGVNCGHTEQGWVYITQPLCMIEEWYEWPTIRPTLELIVVWKLRSYNWGYLTLADALRPCALLHWGSSGNDSRSPRHCPHRIACTPHNVYRVLYIFCYICIGDHQIVKRQLPFNL